MTTESDHILTEVKAKIKESIQGVVTLLDLEEYDKPFMLDITKALEELYKARINLVG